MRKLTALPMLLAFTASTATAAPIEGAWKNPIGSAIIAIAPCGKFLCGKVVWASERGQREVAKNASNVVGMTVLTGLKPAHGHWSGNLYIPDDNIHVSARLQLIGDNQLKLTGCGLLGLICRTQIWTRFDGPFPAKD